MNAIFLYNLHSCTPFFTDLGLVNPNCHAYTGQGDDRTLFHRIPLEEFFSIDPREDEPGAKIYLRDKEFFLSILPDLQKPAFSEPTPTRCAMRPPVLPDPQRPAFSELPLLSDEQKAQVTAIDLSDADISGYKYNGGVFCGYKSLRELDLSTLDTTGFTNMTGMFKGCASLRKLDLSSLDFSRVKYMFAMFANCPNLEEVILPDTILSICCISRIVVIPPARSEPYSDEYLSKLSFDVYRSEGPQMAEMAVDRAIKASLPSTETRYIPVCEATEEETREYLGLQDNPHTKLTFVPYRAPKKQTEPDSSPEKQTEPGYSPEYQKNRNLLQRLFQRK